ncbi:tRNA (guanine-N1)-methyltransferase [Candidatus Rickettsia tasmanensis]
MRRLEKITSHYIEAAKKAEFQKFQSDQAHKMHQQKAEAFRSGTTAAAKKQRKEDYRTGGWGK